MAKGGAREGSGRKEGSTNALTKAGINSFFDMQKQYDLLEKAYNKAMEGDSVVLNKLLDKFLPTLNKNENTNIDGNYEKQLEEVINKAQQILND